MGTGGVESWTPSLVRFVVADPILLNLAVKLPSRGGRVFNPNVANHGQINDRALVRFQRLAESKNIQELQFLLRDIFSYGGFRGPSTGGRVEGSPALLAVEFTGTDGRVDSWMHIDIQDSAEFHDGAFSQYFYKHVRFNIRGYRFVPGEKGGLGKYIALSGQNGINWIRDMQVIPRRIQILIERDAEGAGKASDREATTFQELTLHREENGRISRKDIRNGDSLYFRALWTSQSILIPEEYSK